VTPDKIKSLVPDMPEEFDRMPYAAATSDLIRTALIALHGGVYLDTDFLVQHPLAEFTNELEHADFVSYESHGQDCQKGCVLSALVSPSHKMECVCGLDGDVQCGQ
jgi:mannosyltransferase OCH1-like enzyme